MSHIGCVVFFIAVVTIVSMFTPKTALGVPFANLDFEASPIPGDAAPSAAAPTSELFPSWTVRFGQVVQDTASLNTSVLDADAVALFALSEPSPNVISGVHSAYLQAWFTGSGVSISQIGDVPPDAKSLRFAARNPVYRLFPLLPGVFDVQLAGQSVPAVVLSSQQSGDVLDVVYGVDVTPWAGSTSELQIGISADINIDPAGWSVLDDIQFSAVPLPDPATGWFIGLAMWSLIAGRRRAGDKATKGDTTDTTLYIKIGFKGT